VEYDLDNPLQDPRPGYRRDLQIVQWTFLAKPYHPIFLDVLETAVATIESYRDQGVKENWSEVVSASGRARASARVEPSSSACDPFVLVLVILHDRDTRFIFSIAPLPLSPFRPLSSCSGPLFVLSPMCGLAAPADTRDSSTSPVQGLCESSSI
jgi:hypothetical protein